VDEPQRRAIHRFYGLAGRSCKATRSRPGRNPADPYGSARECVALGVVAYRKDTRERRVADDTRGSDRAAAFAPIGAGSAPAWKASARERASRAGNAHRDAITGIERHF
jgi:hypothetical protein